MLTLALAMVLISVAPAPAGAGLQEDIQRRVRELDELQERLNAVEAQLKGTQRDYQLARQSLSQAEEEMASTRDELAKLQRRRQETEAELARTEGELKALEGKLEERRQMLSRRLRTLYEEGRISYLEVLFGAESFQDFLSRYNLLKMIIRLDVTLFRQVQADRRTAEEHRQEVAGQRSTLVQLQAQTQDKLARVVAVAAEQAAAEQRLAALNRELLSQYEQLEQDSVEIGHEIERLQRLAARQAGQLSFQYPTWPVYITSPFGMRWHPVYGGYRLHTGTDFSASYGQNVYAVEGGVVILAQYYGGYGYAVIIDHGNGISSLYGHNSKLVVQEGQEVDRGDLVALAGSSGVSTGPHVHLEIREYGDPVDPMQYLPAL